MRVTPHELLELGIYASTIAISLHEGEHRRYGVHQIGLKLQSTLEETGTTLASGANWPRPVEPHFFSGALVDSHCYVRGLHDAPDATGMHPEMKVSPVLTAAVARADEERARERERAQLRERTQGRSPARPPKRSPLIWLKIPIPEIGHEADDGALAQLTPELRAATSGKDWLGEALTSIGKTSLRPQQVSGKRSDIEALPDVVWRCVEPSVVEHIFKWRHRWWSGGAELNSAIRQAAWHRHSALLDLRLSALRADSPHSARAHPLASARGANVPQSARVHPPRAFVNKDRSMPDPALQIPLLRRSRSDKEHHLLARSSSDAALDGRRVSLQEMQKQDRRSYLVERAPSSRRQREPSVASVSTIPERSAALGSGTRRLSFAEPKDTRTFEL